ncbi:MAG: MopE-related protein [Thermodesulfobacteriota bacterium]
MGKNRTLIKTIRYICLLTITVLGLLSIIGTGGGGGGGGGNNNGLTTYYRDGDIDGYGDAAASLDAASQPQGYVTDDTDCNDASAAVNPGATEACNDTIDNDCDGQVDEDCTNIDCTDADADGYYAQANCGTAVDCNDARAAVFPGAVETCDDNVDNDCDGQIDEDCPECTDADNDDYFAEGGCDTEVDCDDASAAVNPGAAEVCDDDIDNDCDGEVDEDCDVCTDADDDGYYAQAGCGNAFLDGVDCDDSNPSVHPDALEICDDGIDNDCDGQADEAGDCSDACIDADGDGYYVVAGCGNAVNDGVDCNDNNASIHPGAREICEGLDNDCDGQVDEGCSDDPCTDADSDGYYLEESCGNAFIDGVDCNDANATVHPGAAEVCNDRVDNDCDGQIDENCTTGTCTDADKDGYYVESGCGGAFTPGVDCNDANAAIHPGAAEVCNDRLDNDCDGLVDEGCTQDTFTNSLGMTFRRIPAGTFIMGTGSGYTPHQVTITKDFYVQTTEVTQAQWREAYGGNPSYFSNCGGNCPVERVSWNIVQYFLAAMNNRGEGTYRLPTEAEWEYACRAGSTTAFCNGPITDLFCGYDPSLNAVGWYCYNSAVSYSGCSDISSYTGPTCAGTHPVAQKSPNAWGLYDMHGNVYEWVADRFGDYPSESVIDPTGGTTSTARLYRGGSWHDSAQNCTSAVRHSSCPAGTDDGGGFRLVVTPPGR